MLSRNQPHGEQEAGSGLINPNSKAHGMKWAMVYPVGSYVSKAL